MAAHRREDDERHARPDARSKATGAAVYTADIRREHMVHAAVVRSPFAHARIRAIDTSSAAAMPGVLGIFDASHVTDRPYGRRVRDVPVLARDEVRFVGEPVVAVVADTRPAAERAALRVVVDYEECPAVTTPEAALTPGAVAVHAAPWDYVGAACRPEWGINLQSWIQEGNADAAEEALDRAPIVHEATYTTPAVHQGYIEPQACVAEIDGSGKLHVWLTNKSPYRARAQLADCLGRRAEDIVLEPVVLGGDFGGKGSPGAAPLCAELARLVGRPVSLQLRYAEDLTATNPRHPARITVRIAADEDGHIRALTCHSVLDGGAYAGFKPVAGAAIHGVLAPPPYRVPAWFADARIAYTHTVPKGHMRAPGGPQLTFAIESAMDELAARLGLDPVELRRRNLLHSGDADAAGERWVEHRGAETLDAALAALVPAAAPALWRRGTGIALYGRATPTNGVTSLCLDETAGHRLRVEIPIVETGTGSHAVLRSLLGRELGFGPEEIDVVQVSTDELPRDSGAGGSRVTAALAFAADEAVKAWRENGERGPVRIALEESVGPPVGSYCVQIAQVAVDPETGELRVLELLSRIDVAEIVHPAAHQMQIDGGAVQGFGFACLEDLLEEDGQVWAANLGEFKLPSARDVPRLRTVLVPGGRGVGSANVKNIGESTTPPAAAAIANAVAQATGCRLRALPLRAEDIHAALAARPQPGPQ